MSNYVYNNGELYHARSHKYTKREWRNGRWVYYYKDAFGRIIGSMTQPSHGVPAIDIIKAEINAGAVGTPLKGETEAEKRNNAAWKQQRDRLKNPYASDERSRKKRARELMKQTSFINKAKNYLNSKVFKTQVTIKDLTTGRTIASYTRPGW